MTDHEGPVAGWYPDTEVPGGERYWDGSAWTEHRRAGPPPGTPWGGPPAATPNWSTGTAPTIDTWLWQSIVATVLCCQPPGIVGIVMSAQAGAARDAGNYELAQRRADQARTWTLVAVGIGLVAYVLWGLLLVVGLSAGFGEL